MSNLSASLSGASEADGVPNKPYFKIGEVAKLCGVKPHVLRFWESEFSAIRPQKSKTNQRVYRRKDVLLILRIRSLLYDEKFTIQGARARLREVGLEDSIAQAPHTEEISRENLQKIKQGLRDLIGLAEK